MNYMVQHDFSKGMVRHAPTNEPTGREERQEK